MRNDPVRKVAKADGRYALEAYQFLFEGLDHTVRRQGKTEAQGTQRHISGRDLVDGLRDLAATYFGPLAAQVWRQWGVRNTMDWGRIVFLLVEEGLLNRQDSDTIDDFREVFDLDEAFVESYRPTLPLELGPRTPPPGGETEKG